MNTLLQYMLTFLELTWLYFPMDMTDTDTIAGTVESLLINCVPLYGAGAKGNSVSCILGGFINYENKLDNTCLRLVDLCSAGMFNT